ncbi:hypothetical protein B0T25DRAFT_552244 [Lasiosphaeria hispida]|uniref:Uncharacterized protein n=1 Tax=Lasiosphaeria hispida TaxID=260671 RepID=A0AAJ0HBG6_9PEZI|nr:hypothetical protein B0T25DRAFT_552244 [Lasiosphaeria hispida]
MKINFSETLRLVLLNAFKNNDPALTAKMAQLRKDCPILFTKVLSRQNEVDLLEVKSLPSIAQLLTAFAGVVALPTFLPYLRFCLGVSRESVIHPFF